MTTVPSILTATRHRNRLAIRLRWAVLLAVGAWTHVDAAAAAAAAPEAEPVAAVLDLHGEGFIAGTCADGPAAIDKPQGAIVWRSPAFADPFVFPLDAIRGIRFPRPTGDPPAGGGDWRVELASGDALVGSIESRDDSAVVMVIGSAATPIWISVRRDSIRHFDRVMDRVMDRVGESDSDTGPTGFEGRRVMPSVQVVDAWGSRLSGKLERVTSDAIVIAHPAIAGEVSLPIATLATLTSLRPRQEPSEFPGRSGRLDYDSGTMLGCLAPAPPASAGAAIAWQPAGSLTASPITFPTNGQPQATITYAETPAESKPQLPQRGRKPQVLQQASQGHDPLPPPKPVQVDQTAPDWFGSRLILRTGETLLCRVESIDEQSLRVRVPGGEVVTVAGEWVQALELVTAGGRQLTSEKFRSLTTLPRSQRQQPPTHVLRSVQGDYLRGRLVSMDESTVRMAVEAGPRGKPVTLSRGDVARLIWLHPENIATPWRPPQPIAVQGLLVDATVSATEHLRLVATGIDGNVIRGVNPVIGPCRIDLENVRVLFLGGRRDDLPQTSPYSKWRLTLAADPRNLPPGARTSAAADALDLDATAASDQRATDQPATEPQRVSPGVERNSAADLLTEADRLAAAHDRRAVVAYARLLSADDRDVRSRSISQLRRITAAGLPYGIDDALHDGKRRRPHGGDGPPATRSRWISDFPTGTKRRGARHRSDGCWSVARGRTTSSNTTTTGSKHSVSEFRRHGPAMARPTVIG